MPALEKLPILILYPHSRCNCRCVMCDIWKRTGTGQITAAELERHLEDIVSLQVEQVVFSGGEPLMNRGLFELADLLRRRGVRTTLLSSGLLLERDAARIAARIDEVIVSLDGPPEVHDRIRNVPRAFERLEAGVKALRRAAPGYPAAARTTVQKSNHLLLRRTVETARALALDWISFLAADLTSEAFNRPGGWPETRQAPVALDPAEAAALAAEVEALIAGYGSEIASGFVREGPDKLRRLARHFRAHLGFEAPAAPRCNAPWVSAVMEADGTLRPCFFHEPVGDVRQSGLRGALNGPRAMRFRENLDVASNPVCRRCVCSLYRP